jgi:cytochrome c553
MKILLLLLFSAASAMVCATPVADREFDQVLKRTPDVGHGAKLYETCAACHGANGEGVSDGTVPSLGGQPFNVVARQIVDFRLGKRMDPRMAHFTGTRHLGYSQHVADVAAYIATLPLPKAKAAPRTPDRGAMIYTRACERCHGPAGEGKGDALVPRLAGQHYEYLLRQLEPSVESVRPKLAAAHAGVTQSLARDDIESIAAYLASAGE